MGPYLSAKWINTIQTITMVVLFSVFICVPVQYRRSGCSQVLMKTVYIAKDLLSHMLL